MDTERNDLSSRPDFGPSQVKSPEELVVGRSYVEHYEMWIPGYGWQEKKIEYTIESLSVEEDGALIIKVQLSDRAIVVKDLSDLNIISRKDGTWNTRANVWLENLTKATPVKE